MSNNLTARRPKILIVDDDPLFRSLMMSVLRERYIVFVAADGEEGFRKALAHPPDAAILDIRMPGWDGLKTLRAIRRSETLGSLPVMILSSDASRETVIAAIHSGATDYLIKSSFSKKEFHDKLTRLVECSRHPRLSRPPQKNLQDALARLRHPATTPAPTELQTPPLPPHTPAVEETIEAIPQNSQLQEILDAWE